jgi:long-chain fatty acid transport protein
LSCPQTVRKKGVRIVINPGTRIEGYLKMKKILILLLLLSFVSYSRKAIASNGNDIIGVGPASISLGGTGITAPQDAVSAIFSNPATICFGSYGTCSEFDISLVAGTPKAEAKIKMRNTTIKSSSDDEVFPIPAIGLTMPLNHTFPQWSLGIAAGGVSGLGIDYENSEIDQPEFYDFGPLGKFPLIKGEFAKLKVAKFAPSLAFQPVKNFSLGFSFHLNYGSLDLGNGSSDDYALGAQIGMLYKYDDSILLGATYTSPQEFTYKNVSYLDDDDLKDDLNLEKPQEIGFGVGFIPLKDFLVFEVDLKWKNWSDAKGYDDLDWDNQWITALGAQLRATKKLTIRAGYNYGTNPVREHDNFDGTSLIVIQGKTLPVYYYETFRIFGNPAVEKHHASFGIEYKLTEHIVFDLSYTHIFKATVKERGTDLMGRPLSVESKVYGKALGIGIAFRF